MTKMTKMLRGSGFAHLAPPPFEARSPRTELWVQQLPAAEPKVGVESRRVEARPAYH
jgi:hypothetical protein